MIKKLGSLLGVPRTGLALIFLFFLAFLLTQFLGDSYRQIAMELGFRAPSLSYPLGTDILGRGFFSRIIRGTFISMQVGFFATLLALIIGGAIGGAAGYFGGKLEMVTMRFIDILYGLPTLFFIILMAVVFGQTLFSIIIALGLFSWLTVARIARANAASLRAAPFIESAKVAGASPLKILMRHIYPNILAIVLTYGTLLFPQMVLAEAFLSFLGLGLRPPEVSLGILIKDGAVAFNSAWWSLLFPALALCLILLLGYKASEELKENKTLPDYLA